MDEAGSNRHSALSSGCNAAPIRIADAFRNLLRHIRSVILIEATFRV